MRACAKPSARAPRSTLSSGLLTALSLAVVTGLSAAVGVVIAREFGRERRDGRLLRGLRASSSSSCSRQARSGSPCCRRSRAPATTARSGACSARTRSRSGSSRCRRSRSACSRTTGRRAQLAGGLPPRARRRPPPRRSSSSSPPPSRSSSPRSPRAPSPRHDSYGTAAAGYALGSALGLAVILWRVDEDGIVACAWGPLAERRRHARDPSDRRSLLRADWGRRVPFDVGSRFARAGARGGPADRAPGVLRRLPPLRERSRHGRRHELHVRLLRRLRSRRGDGVVARDRLERAAEPGGALGRSARRRHVVSTSLVSFAAVAAAAGVFALVGEPIVRAALGPAYAGDAGGEIGRLIVLLGPWMAASIGVTITFPLLFVAGKERRLPLLAIAVAAPARRR